MTLIHNTPHGSAAVHALVIGVGAYPHVQEAAMGLAPLTTSFHSATAFARWLKSSMQHPHAELSTIEVLASHPRLSGSSANMPEAPTTPNIQAAFERWYYRCDDAQDNVGIFFFCGHGVEADSQLIFTDDLGKNPLRPLDAAIDIGTTFEGMRTCAALNQYFFVDACREMPLKVVLNRSLRGIPLCDLKVGADPRTNSALLFSTASGRRALGRREHPSAFTSALIQALSGAAGKPKDQAWVIDYGSLHAALCELLVESPQDDPQVASSRGTARGLIHVLPSAPLVPVSVVCRPQAHAVHLACIWNSNQYLPIANANKWTFQVPADQYWVNVIWGSDEAVIPRGPIFALPPSVTTMEVSP